MIQAVVDAVGAARAGQGGAAGGAAGALIIRRLLRGVSAGFVERQILRAPRRNDGSRFIDPELVFGSVALAGDGSCHGNALLGATPSLLEKGIPDAAWDAIEGDDKKTASALKKRNKAASGGQRGLDSLWSQPSDGEAATVVRAAQDLESASDADLGLLHQKESRWQSILDSAEFRRQRLVADMFCAAFVWPKQPRPLAEAAPVSGLWLQLRDHKGVVPALTLETTCALATQYHFLHWHLGFPHIFAKGGFDVVLGNPPWDKVQLEEQHFFARRC